MKKIIFIVLVTAIILPSTAVYAEMFSVDTRVGTYFSSGSEPTWYRNTKVSVNIMMWDLSVRAVHKVYKGVLFRGENNNYSIGGQLVYNLNVVPFTINPFVGMGLNNSDFVNNSLSFDFGANAKMTWLPILAPVVGGEVQTYSDSMLIDYYAGFSIPLLPIINIEALYTGLLDTGPNSHKTGIAIKAGISF